MKVLFIGNSFSQDASRYLEMISNGEIYFRNLYVGGCSFKMHYEFMTQDQAAYDCQHGPENLGNISVTEALKSEDWDWVTVQQVSYETGDAESYEPYMGELIKKIGELCPNAKIAFHKTWAYEDGSDHPGFAKYNCDRVKMYKAICEVTKFYADKYSLPLIPSGDAVEMARSLDEFNTGKGGVTITRDGFHLSLDYGRYLAGLVVNGFFTGKSAAEVTYKPDNTDDRVIEKLKAIADKVLSK